MQTLTQAHYDAFWRDGVITLPDAVTPAQLTALRAEFAGWIEGSRAHTKPYGQMLDGRARFDIEPKSHSATTPALRRVSAPTEISSVYLDVMRNSRMTDMVADLIGPNVKHHHNKINSKQPGSATEVKWHQDFPFTPHSNTDIVTALLMVDEVTDDNGPLEVALGSHKGELHSLWHDGVFTGAVDPKIEADYKRNAAVSKGPAGSVCLMHTCLAHGSVQEVIDRSNLLTYTVSGEGVQRLAAEFADHPDVLVTPFGAKLHVSARDKEALNTAIKPYRQDRTLHWEESTPSLEDVFIDMMTRAKDNFQ